MTNYRVTCKVWITRTVDTYIIANSKEEAKQKFLESDGIGFEEVIDEEVTDIDVIKTEEVE